MADRRFLWSRSFHSRYINRCGHLPVLYAKAKAKTHNKGKLRATITLPAGLSGTFVWKEQTTTLKPGKNAIQ